MNFPAAVDNFEALSGLKGELHLAIGVFDGVHLGHKAVIESAVFSARRLGARVTRKKVTQPGILLTTVTWMGEKEQEVKTSHD